MSFWEEGRVFVRLFCDHGLNGDESYRENDDTPTALLSSITRVASDSIHLLWNTTPPGDYVAGTLTVEDNTTLDIDVDLS